MGTNTGIGIGIGIPFKNNALGGDRPYLPPELKARLIGVWDNYGKKNTDADRNIIKNKIPNAGGDLEILNAAYEGMSGYNGYPVIFGINKTWEKIPTYNSIYSINDNKIHITKVLGANKGLIFSYAKQNDQLYDITEIPSFKIRVSGLKGNSKVKYSYIKTENAVYQTLLDLDNGIHELPKSLAPTNSISNNSWIGFTISPMIEGELVFDCDITIEILPEYEGAFVTDGVNDMIISQKTIAEMGITNEVTIVSMIHQITLNSTYNLATTNYIENSTTKEHVRTDVYAAGKTGIYGYTASLINSTRSTIGYILGDIRDYQAIGTTNKQTILDSKFSVVGRVGGFTELSSVAHYWTFAVLGKATEDDINLIISYFNLDRTLRPDILCNIAKQGITNDNHADFNDKLIDYSGNGRDIQMYNLAWKGDSGVAAKKFETIKDYLIVPDEGLQELTIYNEFSYKVKSIKYADRYWTIQTLNKTDVSYPITIVSDKNIIWRNDINYTDENGVKRSIRKETNVPANTPTQVFVLGFNDFDVPDNYTKVNCVAYATRTDITEFTITFIPSCKGGILLDGIEDFGKVTGMPIYKDYTFIIDRKFLNETFANQVCLASKSKVAVEGENGGAFIIDNISINAIINPYSFYKTTSLPNLNTFDKQIVFQTKYKYLDKDIAAGTATDSDTLWLGTFRDNDSRFANVAIYSLMSFPYSMSEFLIERQLKKHKLGTLYPDMVEFRPVIKKDDRIKSIKYYIDGKTANIGQYYPIGTGLGIAVETVQPYMVKSLKVNGVNTIPNADYKGFNARLDSKSPQKITMDIQVDTNLIQWNPIITSTVELTTAPTFAIRGTSTLLKPGDWIPKNSEIWVIVTMNNLIDELRKFSFNGTFINIPSSSYNPDTGKYGFPFVIDNESTQNINLTIDEYIRFEDIVQPYPVLLRFNDENGNEVSWGGKFRVGSTITRIGSAADSNLLPNIYNIFGLLLNDNQVTSSKVIVEKTMVFKAKSTYIFDNNEPKCILSPSRLRIPNSSYKLLGYIPDISGHGNHGVIHNSAYAEGSGVNEDGSYQFDGVDDFITIPTTVGGKQVLMKVNWQSIAGTAILYDQRTNGGFAIFNRDFDTNENKVPAYRARNIGGSTYIDGILNEYIYASELKDITHNIVELCDPELNTGTLNPKIGSSFLNSNYTQMSLYDFMLFDEISTDDKILELNTYIGITPKVTLPNYYWDNYGKKNTDANRGHVDEQVSLQKTGTSVNPLENFNIGYEGMSGYNGYPVVFGANKTWETSNAVDYIYDINSTIVHITNVKHAANGLLYSYVKRDGALANIKEIPAFRVTVGGLEGNSKFAYRYLATEDATEETLVYLGNGTHELAKSFAPTEALLDLTRNAWVGIFITPMVEGEVVFDCDITIEVLPEYENGLAYDGVSDFSQNTEIEVVEDFTFLVKGSLLKGLTGSGGCIARKGDKKHYDTGGYAFIYCFDSPIESYRNSYYSFGKNFVPSKKIVAPPLIGYMTKTNVNGETTTFGTNSDIKGIIFGNWSSGYMNMVIYKSIFYTKTISLLEINFLKNLMEKDEIIDINHPIFISNTEDESNTSQDT